MSEEPNLVSFSIRGLLSREHGAKRLRRQGSSALAASVGGVVKGRRSRARAHVATGSLRTSCR